MMSFLRFIAVDVALKSRFIGDQDSFSQGHYLPRVNKVCDVN